MNRIERLRWGLAASLLFSGISSAGSWAADGSFEFSGNAVLATKDLQRVAQRLGADASMEDLRLAIEAYYQSKGYSLVRVLMPQKQQSGSVRIEVEEIPVASISVKGAERSGDLAIRRSLPALQGGEMLDFDALGRQLAFANETGHRKVQVDFIADDAGEVGATISVRETKPWDIGLQVNNTGSDETGDWRATLSAAHYNLFQRDHEAILTVTKSPDNWDALDQVGFYYRVPFPSVGGRLTLNAVYSDTNTGRVAGAFDISGQGTHFVASYRHMLKADPDGGHYLSIGFAHKAFDNTVDFLGTDLGVDVTTRPVSVEYDFDKRYGRALYSGSVGFHANLSGGDNNDDATYQAARYGASADWTKWTATLSAQWQTKSDWIIRLTERMQYASDPLISGEQFGVGGAYSVRGLEEREGAGDRGISLSLEAVTPEWKGHRGVVFTDAGKIWRNSPLPGETPSEDVMTIGVGWRWKIRDDVNLAIDVAGPLKDFAGADEGDVKAHIGLSISF